MHYLRRLDGLLDGKWYRKFNNVGPWYLRRTKEERYAMTSYAFYVVISKPNCSECKMAIEFMDSNDIPFTNVDISRASYIKTLVQMADLKTVPQIFWFNGDYIGGFEDLKLHLAHRDAVVNNDVVPTD